MNNQDIYNAYAGSTTIEALLYENFDAVPQWKQVKVKEMSMGVNGIEWIELIILKDGWPTPWHATIAQDKFATDLRRIG